MVQGSRTSRSRAAMLAAATALLDAGEVGDITITDVVARAGVSRPTFYQHFGDLSTLFRDAALLRLEEAFSVLDPEERSGDPEASVSAAVRLLLDHMRAHADFYRRVLRGASGRDLTASTVAFLADRLQNVSPLRERIREADGVHPEDRVTVLAAGTVWLIIGWLSSDFTGDDSVPVMSARLSTLLLTLSSATTPAARPSSGD